MTVRGNILVLLLALTLGARARAAEVISATLEKNEIVISQEKDRPYKKGESVCITVSSNRVKCGKVIRANASYATIKLNMEAQGADILPAQGETVKTSKQRAAKTKKKKKVANAPAAAPTPAPNPAAANAPSRTPTSTERTRAVEEKIRRMKMNERPFFIGIGMDAGINYAFGAFRIERAFSRYFALGLNALYTNNFSSVSKESGVGGSLTASVYLNNRKNFEGFFLQTGVGYYSLSLEQSTISEKSSGLAIPFTLNWRARVLRFEPFVGVGFGGQYYMGSSTSRINFSGLLPLFKVEMGICF